MKTISKIMFFAGCAFLWPDGALAVGPADACYQVELQKEMSALDYRNAGLAKLTPDERGHLELWLTERGHSGGGQRTARHLAAGRLLKVDLNSLIGANVIAADGAFLGKIISPYSFDSIVASQFGDKSLCNKECPYGDSTNELSPFNAGSARPATIVKDGRIVGHLSANQSVDDRLDPGVLVGWLRSRRF